MDRVRTLVNEAALSSGWFSDFGELTFTRKDYQNFAIELRSFRQQLNAFGSAAAHFFGEPDDGSAEPYDPWPERKILDELYCLALRVTEQIAKNEKLAEQALAAPPSAAKPERDLWMARLMLVWCKACGREKKNSKHLRGFILEAQRPYMGNGITERMAEQFIERWNREEIKTPEPSPWFSLTD